MTFRRRSVPVIPLPPPGVELELATEMNQTVSHSKGSVTITTVGDERTSQIEMYTQKEGDSYTVYFSADGTDWTSQP